LCAGRAKLFTIGHQPIIVNKTEPSLRTDKWLWVARLFKTRSAASAAIKGGKVHIGSQRVKPSHLIKPGNCLEITLPHQVMTIVVNGIRAQRRPAREAQLLYTETEDSRARREIQAQQRRLLNAAIWQMPNRPDKRQRRQIRRFTGKD
jgi:ribosome-associated heat shock protein Hsp15